MKKSLGQNFLQNEFIASSIVDAAGITKNDIVFEIGPGNGSLTKWIVEKNPKKCFLLEFDRDLIENLENKFPDFEVLNKNATDFNFNEVLKKGDEVTVISNLPYNVSKKILFNLIDHRVYIKKMILMFQKEVGERLVARVGESSYSALTIMASEFFSIEPLLVVKAEEFIPKPKVDSMVLVFERLSEPMINLKDRIIYEEVLIRIFSNRRKMLRKILKDYLKAEDFLKLKQSNIINLDLRPQNLSIRDLENLSNFIYSLKY